MMNEYLAPFILSFTRFAKVTMSVFFEPLSYKVCYSPLYMTKHEHDEFKISVVEDILQQAFSVSSPFVAYREPEDISPEVSPASQRHVKHLCMRIKTTALGHKFLLVIRSAN